MIDNPDCILGSDEEDEDDDPEILEEMDKRNEEIIEQFMEMSYNCKHDAREAALASAVEGEDIDSKLEEINKTMDAKRKKGLKELKKKLNDIITDESIHASARL